MSFSSRKKKRSYSFVYKMYRRIRYVRYKRRIQRAKFRELKLAALLEEKEVRRKLSEFKKQEKLQQRIKLKAEKDQDRKIKADLSAELREQKKQVKYEIQRLSKEINEKEHFQNKIERKERRRLLRQFMRIQIRNLKHLPREVNTKNIRRLFTLIISAKTFLIISFNSAVLFILSYLTLFLIGQFVTVLAAGFFDYPTIVYYYEVYFIISPEDWYHDSVKTIFSSGPLVNMVIGISFLIIYNNIQENTGTFKLFFLWGYLHAVSMLFGAMLVGTLFETGVGHVISWMYIMDTGRVLYSIISIFILVLAGLLAARPFLISANSYYGNIGGRNKTHFLFAQVMMPYILGNAFLIAARLPRFIYYDTFIVVTLILSIIPVMLAGRAYTELYFEEEAKQFRFTWMNALILTVVVFLFRGILEAGIRFGG